MHETVANLLRVVKETIQKLTAHGTEHESVRKRSYPPLLCEMDEKPPEIERDESLPEGTLFLHLIDQKEGRYRLFSRHSDGEMKYTGNFDDVESAKAYADLLDLSKN